ncbi:hypothetical protein PshuTeo1_41770 [Pseudomonas hunanensis]|nr:hypothetical protein PshuTeo1_41770 [Pseudomonas hunanensis]
MHLARKTSPGADVYKRPKATIVIHATTGVEDGTITNLAKRVNHGRGKHYTARSQADVLTDHGSRMDYSCHDRATLLEQLLFSATDGVIANCNNHTLIGTNRPKELRTAPDNWPYATNRAFRPGIVKKVDMRPTA